MDHSEQQHLVNAPFYAEQAGEVALFEHAFRQRLPVLIWCSLPDDPRLFDRRLDVAVRDWARRSDPVRDEVRRADAARIDAIAGLFARFGAGPTEALVRARTRISAASTSCGRKRDSSPVINATSASN